MSLRIITDSSSDYTVEEARELNIDLVPLTLSFDGVDYLDGIEITKEEFYDLLVNKKKYPKTSQPTPERFLNIFLDVKEKKQTALVICLGKSFSGTYNSALIAKNLSEYEDIHVVECPTTIAGLRILVEEAIKQDKLGKNVNEIIDVINDLKERIMVFGCLNTLEYLSKGGRLKASESFLGNLLNLKPIISFKTTGEIYVVSKPIGHLRAVSQMIKLVEKYEIDDNYPVYYYYSSVDENMKKYIEKLKKNNLYKEGKVINLSPVIGCHIGDKCYAIVYVRK